MQPDTIILWREGVLLTGAESSRHLPRRGFRSLMPLLPNSVPRALRAFAGLVVSMDLSESS